MLGFCDESVEESNDREENRRAGKASPYSFSGSGMTPTMTTASKYLGQGKIRSIRGTSRRSDRTERENLASSLLLLNANMTALSPAPPSPPSPLLSANSRVLFKPLEGAATGGCHAEIYLPKMGAVGPSKVGKKGWPVGELELPSSPPFACVLAASDPVSLSIFDLKMID